MAGIVKRPWTNEEELQLAEMYAAGVDTRIIAERLDRSRRSVRGKAHGLGLSHKTRDDYLYTAEEDAFIIENAKQMTRAAIGASIGRSEGSVSQRGKLLGVIFADRSKNAIYDKDHSFFTQPNLINSHIAGWLATDGWVRPESSGKAINQVGIAVSAKDRVILEHIQSVTNYTGVIREFEVDLFPQVELRISGVPQWLEDLKTHWNITPNKTYSLQPPQIDALTYEQLLAYQVGLLEGDGYICITNKTLKVSFVSASKPFVEWVGQVWSEITGGMPSYETHISGNAFYVHVYGKNARQLCRELLKVNVHKLNRKWDIAQHEVARWDELDRNH